MRSAKCALEFNIEDDAGVTSHLNCFFKLNSSTQCLGIRSQNWVKLRVESCMS